MTTPEVLRAAPRFRAQPAEAPRRGAPGSTQGLDAPFDPAALARWDEGLGRLEARS